MRPVTSRLPPAPRGFAGTAGSFSHWCLTAFARILGLSGRRAWLIPVTVVLLPVAVLLVVAGGIAWSVASMAGLWGGPEEGGAP